MARPKKAANVSGDNVAKQEVKNEVLEDQDFNTEGFGKIEDEPKEVKVEPTVAELKAQIEKLKAGKVVEVQTETKKEVRIRPSEMKKQTHTVYVTKKEGGQEQTREMSEQAYNAIVKDPGLRVTLPKNSLLVEPQPKGCKDC